MWGSPADEPAAQLSFYVLTPSFSYLAKHDLTGPGRVSASLTRQIIPRTLSPLSFHTQLFYREGVLVPYIG